jgi:hypothetical protein
VPLVSLGAFASGASGCRQIATTQLVVVVDTNLTARDGLSNVHVIVQSPEGAALRESDFELSPSGPFTIPLSFGVVPLNRDARRRVRIIAQARDASGAVLVQRSALTGFLSDASLRLPLYLPNVCRGLECPTGTTCRGDAPVCVDDEVLTEQLAPLSPRADGGEFDGGFSLPFVEGGVFVPDATARDSALDARPDAAVDARTDSGPSYLPIPSTCAYPMGANGMRVTIPATAPRLVAPLSLGHVTSLRPTLRWTRPAGADGARVELCEDRACARNIARFDSALDADRPAAALPPGRVVFWRVLPLTAGTVSGPSSPVWYFVTPHADLAIDTSFQAQTDFNGDGFADVGYIAVTSSGLRTTLGGAVFHGGPSGLCLRPQATWSYNAPTDGTTELTGSGDINGDGFGDMIYSAVTMNGAGTLTVRYGSPGGLDFGAGGSSTVASPAGTVEFGVRVRIIGDINRDGFADVAVSLKGVTASTTAGGVRVYYGSATGLATTPAASVDGASGEQLGLDVVSGGADFDGDGYHDLAMARRGTGGVTVRRGSAMGLDATSVTRAAPMAGRLATLATVSAADINGDGRSDLAFLTSIATGNALPSQAAVFAGDGASTLAMTAGWTLGSAAGATFLGAIRAGDSTGDDAAELLIVERTGTSPNFVFSPRVYVSTAGAAITLAPSMTAIDLGAVRGVGQYAIAPGDLNGDGRGDFAVNTSFVNAYGYGGFVQLLSGAAGWSAGFGSAVPVGLGTLGSGASNEAFE